MCGRFAQKFTGERLQKKYHTINNLSFEPNYNIAPSSNVPIVVHDEDKNLKIEFMKWGLVLHWSKDEEIGNKMINARAETILEKPSFKSSFKSKRCIIPVSGFYEWDKSKQPYYVTSKNNIFSLAGIWDEWKAPTGNPIHTFTIITTDANLDLVNIHNRMPVILDDKDISIWFDHSVKIEELQSLLRPYNSENMEQYTVDKRVNNPANNDEGLIIK
jgi:putative SOS response-associated peptidase YedK